MSNWQEVDAAQASAAARGARHIGDLVAWDYASTVDAPRGEVKRAFSDEGVNSVVPAIGPSAALMRSASEAGRPAGLDVRPLARPDADTSAAIGVYAVVAGDEKTGDARTLVARVRLEVGPGPAGLCAVARDPDGWVPPPHETGAPLAAEIAARANHLLEYVAARDVSLAMTRALESLDSVPIRERGGMYLVPAAHCERWARIMAALVPLGVAPIRIPMHDDVHSVAAAGRAAQGALESELAALADELRAAQNGAAMKGFAVERRVAALRQLRAKAELYRGVLSAKADEIGAACDAMAAAFSSVVATEESTWTLS